MTQQFDNTNRGALFSNRENKKTEKHPDYSGSLNVGGVEYFLDAWLKTSQNGAKFMSVSVKRKDKQEVPEPRSARRQPEASAVDRDSDDIPF